MIKCNIVLKPSPTEQNTIILKDKNTFFLITCNKVNSQDWFIISVCGWIVGEAWIVVAVVVVMPPSCVVAYPDSDSDVAVEVKGQNLCGGRLLCFGFFAFDCSGLLASNIG